MMTIIQIFVQRPKSEDAEAFKHVVLELVEHFYAKFGDPSCKILTKALFTFTVSNSGLLFVYCTQTGFPDFTFIFQAITNPKFNLWPWPLNLT